MSTALWQGSVVPATVMFMSEKLGLRCKSARHGNLSMFSRSELACLVGTGSLATVEQTETEICHFFMTTKINIHIHTHRQTWDQDNFIIILMVIGPFGKHS